MIFVASFINVRLPSKEI